MHATKSTKNRNYSKSVTILTGQIAHCWRDYAESIRSDSWADARRQAVLLFMWGDKPNRFVCRFWTFHVRFGLFGPNFHRNRQKIHILLRLCPFHAMLCLIVRRDCCSMDKIKVLVTGGQEEKDTSSLMDDVNESCKCSRKTRLYGFVICACIGFFISFLVRLLCARLFEILPHVPFSDAVSPAVIVCDYEACYIRHSILDRQSGVAVLHRVSCRSNETSQEHVRRETHHCNNRVSFSNGVNTCGSNCGTRALLVLNWHCSSSFACLRPCNHRSDVYASPRSYHAHRVARSTSPSSFY